MNSTHRKAVLLMNLGSPDTTSVKDVRSYLNEFLMDERVIDIPAIPRALLVKGIISMFRAPRSAKAYRSIWTEEGSPLVWLTKQLKDAIQDRTEMPVEICMRYGNPSTAKVLKKMHDEHTHLEEIVLFPLYPHYAMSSYETAVVQVQEMHKEAGYSSVVKVVEPFYDDPTYINALGASITSYLDTEYDKILFSYHGIPERHIRKGDSTGCHCLKTKDCCETKSEAHIRCYRHQTFKTTKLVSAALNIPHQKYEHSFQSRLGRDPWLTPYTAVRLKELPGEGIRKLVIVCPAFVSDCLETLEEIAEEGREIFLKAGGETFTVVPCLNLHPLWIDAMMGMIMNKVGAHAETA